MNRKLFTPTFETPAEGAMWHYLRSHRGDLLDAASALDRDLKAFFEKRGLLLEAELYLRTEGGAVAIR